MSSEKRGTIGSFALLGMTVAAVFGIKNIINNNAAIGLRPRWVVAGRS